MIPNNPPEATGCLFHTQDMESFEAKCDTCSVRKYYDGMLHYYVYALWKGWLIKNPKEWANQDHIKIELEKIMDVDSLVDSPE